MNLPRSQWNQPCSIDGCEIKAEARRLCKKHYTRWRRHGDPQKTILNMKPVTWEYMLSCSKENKSTGCVEWQKGISSGYGRINDDGKHTRTHRVAYELNNGPIPDDMYVCHTCDNRSCINQEHLFLGTHNDNMRDMSTKGRTKTKHLNDEDVAAIKNSNGTHSEIANSLGFSYSTVFRVMNGLTKRSAK